MLDQTEIRRIRINYFVMTILMCILVYAITKKSLSYVPEKDNFLIKKGSNYKIPFLSKRDDIGLVLEELKAEQMIEIGTQSGNFAISVLSKWPSFKMYYGIDPWKYQLNYKDESNVNDEEHLNAMKLAEERLVKPYGERVKLHLDNSRHAIKHFRDYTIDFIYIDGRHDYCAVTEDLSLYYPKLKCGGIMAGSEYFTVEEQYRLVLGDYGVCANGERVLISGGAVKGAVTEFAKLNRINDIKTTNESLPSFYFIKPC